MLFHAWIMRYRAGELGEKLKWEVLPYNTKHPRYCFVYRNLVRLHRIVRRKKPFCRDVKSHLMWESEMYLETTENIIKKG